MVITREQALQELQRRRGNSSTGMPSVSNIPTISKQQAIEELNRRKASQEPSMGERALALGKGALSGLGGGALDTAALIYNLPAMLHNMKVKGTQGMSPEQLTQAGLGEYYRAQEVPTIPSAVEGLEKGIESATGIKTPEDMRSLYEGAKFAGELGGLGGIGKAAGKLGMKGLEKAGKALGITAPSQLAGATAMGTAMHNVGEEYGPLAGLPAGAVAGTLATKGMRGITEIGKGLKGTFTGKGETLGEMTIGKALSLSGEPTHEIERISKQEGIDLPFNIRLKSPVANFLANTGLNTIFTTTEYKNKIENAPRQMIDAVMKRIDEVSPENLGTKGSSDIYQAVLKEEQESIEKNASQLYDYAKGFLNKEDKVKPLHTVNAIKELRNYLSAPVPSEPMSFVINRVDKLANAWNLADKHKLKIHGQGESALGSYDNILKALHKNPESVPVEDLIHQRQAFMHDLRNKDAYGSQRQLGRLIKALDEDIGSYKNEDFLNHWRAANSYFKTEVANRVRSDFSRSLSEGTFPKQAYDYMTSPEKIKELHRILGTSTQVNQVMNGLKRAKLQDVLMSRAFNADGTIRFAAFSDMFKKGNKNQDLLKELLGDKPYNDLKDISHIASAYSKAGKEFANPSGTATRAQDLMRLGSLIPVIASGGTGLSAVAGSIVTPYVLSKVLANPRYTDAAVKYAMEAKKGNLRGAESYQNKMKNIFYDFARKGTPHQINQQIESEQ